MIEAGGYYMRIMMIVVIIITIDWDKDDNNVNNDNDSIGHYYHGNDLIFDKLAMVMTSITIMIRVCFYSDNDCNVYSCNN